MLLVGLIAVFSTINDFANKIIEAAEKKALERLEEDSIRSRSRHVWKILFSILGIAICLIIGTIFFMYNEEWGFVESLYFSVVTTVSGILDLSTFTRFFCFYNCHYSM